MRAQVPIESVGDGHGHIIHSSRSREGRFLASKADLPRRISAILKWLSVFIVDGAEELLRLVICATAAVSGTVDCGLKLATKIHLWPPITA